MHAKERSAKGMYPNAMEKKKAATSAEVAVCISQSGRWFRYSRGYRLLQKVAPIPDD